MYPTLYSFVIFLIQYCSDKTYCYVNLATEKTLFFVAFYYGYVFFEFPEDYAFLIQ